MVNISTTVRGHYGNDVYLWAIIIRRFCDSTPAFWMRPWKGKGGTEEREEKK
jgi:hypothetical protein